MNNSTEIEIQVEGENLTLRSVGIADTDKLHELDVQCFPREQAFTKGYFHLLFLFHQAFGWALEKGDLLVAFILVTLNRKQANVSTIDVHPDFRKKGIGKRLMLLAEDALQKMGAKKCTLQVALSNSKAIRLYKQLGYRVLRILHGYYPDKEDGYLMEKLLSEGS